jgi:hypothetical protein
MGENAKTVAAMIHKDWGCFDTHALSTVQTMVFRYRRSITSKTLVKRIERSMGSNKHVKALDTMVELTEIIKTQRGRIKRAIEIEDKTKMLMAQTGIELRLLKDLCRDLAYLQMETGILPRAPKTVTGAFGTPDGKQVSFSWTESDEALLENLESGRPLIEGKALPATETGDDE